MLKENKLYIGFMIFLVCIWIFVLNVQAFEPTSSIIYQGIDVSQWQGEINFFEVANNQIEIVYIKSSEGSSYKDPYFEENYEKAKNAGLKIGFYHYVTARNVQEAERQAEFFASVISGKQSDCKLAMDFESFGNLNIEEINNISETFLNKIKDITGKEVVIYSDVYNARNVFNRELANQYPIWVAEYGVENPSETNWENWVGFQYTNQGKIEGINGSVDRDRFTQEILLSDISIIPTVTIPEKKQENYVVKRGDTLSSIATEFNTSISTLVKLNNIKNPNLIYVNQILIIQSGNINDLNHILYTVKPRDTLTAISRRYNVSINSIVELNDISNPNLIYVGEILRILLTENEF